MIAAERNGRELGITTRQMEIDKLEEKSVRKIDRDYVIRQHLDTHLSSDVLVEGMHVNSAAGADVYISNRQIGHRLVRQNDT
jgi:hypothetical protein